MQRRRFLIGVPAIAAGAVVACSARPPSRAAVGALIPAPQQSSRVILVPALANDGAPLHAALSASQAFQGGAVRVTASAGHVGSATLFGRTSALVPSAAGLETFVGLGTQDPPGTTVLEVAVEGPLGGIVLLPFAVLKTDWTADYIIIPPPDPNDPDPPPPDLPDEQPRLNELYRGLAPRHYRDGWTSPLAPPAPISGYFGEQRSFNGGPLGGHHGGTDFGVIAGTPVLAVNDGTVVLAERVRVRGRLVVIDHGGGVFSAYAHMSEISVQPGASVVQGQRVGLVGSTGLSTAPHLHWELAVGGVLVDGLRWLDGSQGF